MPKIHWNAFYAKWEMFTFQTSSTHSGLFQCSVFFQMCCPWTSSAGPGKENTKLCEKWSTLSPTCLYIKINLNYGKFLGKPFNFFFHHHKRTFILTNMKLSSAFAEFIIVDVEVGSSLVEETVMLLLHVHHNSLSNKNTYAFSASTVTPDSS